MVDIGGILSGFVTVFQPAILPYLIIGFFVGLFFGVVPGLTATLAIALLLPLTFGMETVPALVTCMAIYMAGIYSGSVTATTINIPGAPCAMMTQLEGYPMMQRGEGAKALGHGAFASMIGGIIGVTILMFVAPVVARGALLLQSSDRFSLILLALVVVALIGGGSIAKGVAAAALGIMIGTIGIDPTDIVARFSFGIQPLVAGVGLIPVIVGAFAISEVLLQAETGWKGFGIAEKEAGAKLRRRDFIPRLRAIKEIGIITYLKSAVLGTGVGALPGAGATMAAFISYAEAKRASKHPERFGTGEVQGIAAAETANNAMCGGAIIPLVTLGIPGDTVTAMVFGVLLIHGMVPGPQLIVDRFDVIAPMYAALMVTAVLVFISLLIIGPYYIRIARINRAVLYTFIAMIAMIGTYASEFSTFQLAIALVMGVLAYFFRKHGYPIVPVLMGMILGPIAEVYFRQAVFTSHGDWTIFFTRPASIVFLILTAVFIYFLAIRKVRKESSAE